MECTVTLTAEQRPAPGTRETVDFWFDPVCPWAWLTSRWMMEVEQVRPVGVTWHVMSLSMLNAEREGLSDSYRERMQRAWLPVRVITAAATLHGPEYVKPLYDAVGTRVHLDKQRDYREAVTGALDEVGLPAELIEYGERDDFDEALRASHNAAMDQVGDDVGTPVIAVDGHAFFGPVFTPAPKGEHAGRLWDAVRTLGSYDGFYEIKRSRTQPPLFD